MTTPAPTTLLEAFADQDETFHSAFTILTDAIEQQAFPAASIAVTHRDRLVALKSFGRIIPKPSAPSFSRTSREVADSDSDPVSPATLFDVASLTKPIATTTAAAILYQRGLLELDAPVVAVLPEFLADSCEELDPRRPDVTFRMLLAHSSGLPAYEKLFLNAHTRDELLLAALTTPLSADPGTCAQYSDIGFIILAAALERITQESLAVFSQREIFGPLAMTNTTFNPPTEIRPKIPPTADERNEPTRGTDTPDRQLPAPKIPSSVSPTPRSTFRNKIIQGEVQDENASILGGIAGHAGLFSTAEDLAKFAHALLHRGLPILRPETLALFTRRESTPPATTRTLGWDTPSTPSQSGKYFSPNSFGHLGYTGTSLWIDPTRQLSITLLTNRTWPDCQNQSIKEIRPKFHNAIIESLK